MKLAVVALALLVPAAVLAEDLMCGPVEPGQIQLDGIEDDWVDVQGVEMGSQSPDLSFTFKCNVEGSKMYLLVDVHDNYFVRTKQNHPGEDHVELTLAGRRLSIYPGNARDIPTKVNLPSVKASAALQEKGWAAELMVPLAAIGQRGASPIPYRLTVADCDSKAQLKTDKTLEATGNIVFAEGDATLDAFLGDRHLSRKDIWLDKPLATGKKSGARLVMAGKLLGLIGDGFSYIELPVQSRADIKDVKLLDLAGDGRQEVVVRFVERGNGGSREILAAYRPGDNGVERAFAAEVAKTAAAGRIEDKVAFVKRGRATDIVIDAGSATMTKDKWSEWPAEDIIPIKLPWDADRHARYQFSGDQYKRAQ